MMAHLVQCPDVRTCLALQTALEAEGVLSLPTTPTVLVIQPEDQPGGITFAQLQRVLTMFQFSNN